MSQVIKAGGILFAVELEWGAVLAAGTAAKALSAETRRRKSKLVVTHEVNRALRGLTADTECYGFFVGKAPRGKLFSLASMFARLSAEKEALLALALDEQRVLMVGVKNGRPMLDQLVDFKEATEVALHYKLNDAPDGALLYMLGECWDRHQDVYQAIEANFASHYHGEDLDLLKRADEMTRLRSGDAGMSVAQLVLGGVVLLGTYIVIDTYVWPDEKPAAAVEIDADAAYEQSRDMALASRSIWKAQGLVDAIMAKTGKEHVTLAGWNLSGRVCTLPKGIPAPLRPATPPTALTVSCVDSWSPAGGAMDDLAKALPGVMFSMKNNVASGQVSNSYQITATMATVEAQKLPTFQDVLIGTGSSFKRGNDGGIVTSSLSAPTLIGIIPTRIQDGKNMPAQLKKPVVHMGTWSMTGPLGFTGATPRLPDNFALSQIALTIEPSKDSFSIDGIYLVRN